MIIGIILFLFILTINSIAEPYVGGEFKFTKSYYIVDKNWQTDKDNFHLFDLYLRNETTERLDFKVRFQTRIWDYSGSTVDLNRINSVLSYEIIPWEIWCQINDIPFKNLSLKIGKQYFEWGTADGIHPTSVLNPDDYTKPFAMNEKIPVNAVNINYFMGDFKIFLIWIPTFTPVKLPQHFPFYDTDLYQIPGSELNNINENNKTPSHLSDGMGKACKISFTLFDIDLSTGVFHGYDYIPVDNNLVYSVSGNKINQLDLEINRIFPEMNVYTFDYTTSIEGFGFWGELGVYDYDKEETLINTPSSISTQEIFSGEPYSSYVLGTDYSFMNGLYINLQYAYGLPYVRGKDLLEDYIMFSLKDTFFNSFLEVDLSHMLGFKRKKPIKYNYEIMVTQEIKTTYFDNIIIGLIFSEIYAKGDVLFYSWQEYDYMEFYVTYSF